MHRFGTAEVTVPWYIWCVLLSVAFNLIGVQWDVAWHLSIGRDAFWTPPHIAIYMCPVLCSIACGYLVLSRTLCRMPYMGMQGHAQFVRSDRSVFAHVHPGGTVSMAAMALVGAHTNHVHEGNIPPVISFLYGFPQPGLYRIFVQVKRRSHVDTGIFDVEVEP